MENLWSFVAIAVVLSNWHNVLRAINMASGGLVWRMHVCIMRVD